MAARTQDRFGSDDPSRSPRSGILASALLITLIVVLDLLEGRGPQYVGLLVSAPLLGATFATVPVTVAIGAAALATGAAYGAYDGVGTTPPQLVRLLAIVLATVLAGGAAHLRTGRERRLAEITTVAEIAQQAVLRPIPPVVGNVRVAVHYVSASAEAHIGGDLYEVLETRFGVRILIGDVRGKGLGAVRLASNLLGSFRQVTHDRRYLEDVVRDLDLAVARTGGEEDFVTAIVAEVAPDGALRVLSCGHPDPFVRCRGEVTALVPPAPSLPLGLNAEPRRIDARLEVGDRLLLYTDGLTEARSRSGAWFPLSDAVADALAGDDVDVVLSALHAALDRHVGGRLSDDVALVVVERTDHEKAAGTHTHPRG